LPCTRSARPPRTYLPRITNLTKEASSARCCLPFQWLTAKSGMSPRARGCNPRRDLLGRILSSVQRSQPTCSGVSRIALRWRRAATTSRFSRPLLVSQPM
jgi:hypothetical protein